MKATVREEMLRSQLSLLARAPLLFRLIPFDAEVPYESTVRKLTRWLGAGVVAELSRAVIGKAQRDSRSLRRRTGQAKSEVLALAGQTGCCSPPR